MIQLFVPEDVFLEWWQVNTSAARETTYNEFA